MDVSDVKSTMEAKKGTATSGSIPYNSNISDIVEQLRSQGFLNTQKLTFLVHGFCGNMDDAWMKDMQNYMVQEDPGQTVVRFDWRKGAAAHIFTIEDKLKSYERRLQEIHSSRSITEQNKKKFLEEIGRNIQGEQWFIDWLFLYHTAAATTQTVGKWLGDVAGKIKERQSTIVIQGVGHSLGAHLLGKAGRSSGAFSRITGLDPAGPDFEDGARDKMLSKSNAEFVDVIHTNGYDEGFWPFLYPVNHFGTLIPLGDVDFYPNYGTEQPGCSSIGGSHSRVLDYYNYTIKNHGVLTANQVLDGTPGYEKQVKKTKRGRPAEMGYYCEESSRGLYYISITKDEVPMKYTH
ncbi:phospholipase A1-like [Ptychodera flava]|uniref:phospholipase A1-like n=1 Tax=Ptychodera flava TaxID=63121 RepID=UPI00396AA72A